MDCRYYRNDNVKIEGVVILFGLCLLSREFQTSHAGSFMGVHVLVFANRDLTELWECQGNE